MSFTMTLILTVQLLTALGMIGLILLQHGKGADMGAAFGGGASGSLFGATGSANFLSRTTAVLATVFFACTLALAYLSNAKPTSSGSVLEGAASAIPAAQTPAVDASATVNVPPPTPATPATGAAQIPAK